MARTHCPRCSLTHSPLCPQPRRWPLADLLTAMARRGSTNPATDLGTGGEAWRRAHLHGLTDATADVWAVRAGFHPAQVFGWEWVEAGLSVTDQQFLEGGWRPAWLHQESARIAYDEAGKSSGPGAASTAPDLAETG